MSFRPKGEIPNTLLLPNKSLAKREIGTLLTALPERLARPVDAASLATFRLLFGALMVWEVGRYFSHDFIAQYYIEPRFHFTYELFPFVSPLPGQGMYWLFGAMGLFALGLALGFCTRWSAFLFFLTYTYVFLLDKTPYNNHYYLIILLSFLFILVEAQRWLSLDQWRRPTPSPETIPFWQLLILRAQIFIVYFYGGLAKLNHDWLMGEPMRLWLAERAHDPLLGPFFATEAAIYFFSYGGLLFDLAIGFLLLWRPTRLWAFFGLLFFHLMNHWLFSIGIFPFLALAATLLFIEPDQPRRMLHWFNRRLLFGWANQPSASVTSSLPGRLNTWTLGFVILYLALQLLIPLRHWLYPGNVSWTEEGHRFAWHMKLRDKESRLELKIIDPHTGKTWNANLKEDLTAGQIQKMATRPDMILQYAHYLKEKLAQTDLNNPIIIANAWVSLNGRPFQQLIDPRINLAQVQPHPFAHAPWILPLTEELPHPAWRILPGLIIVTMILANLGLALTIYFAVDFKNGFLVRLDSFNQDHTAVQSLSLSQAQVAELIKVLSNLLPYLAILLALAAWTMTGQPVYLGVALSAALLAAGWGFYLAPILSTRFARSAPLVWLTPVLCILTGLFILMLLIAGAP